MVLGATQLKNVESWGKQDPYVTLELSGQKFTTKVKEDGGKKPVWNERFTFVNTNSQYSTELAVKVVDRNVVKSDTPIGSSRIPLMRVYASRATEEIRAQLADEKGKSAGELQLLLTFKPYASAPSHHQPGYAPHPAHPSPMYGAPPMQPPAPYGGYPPAPQPGAPSYPPQYPPTQPGYPPL